MSDYNEERRVTEVSTAPRFVKLIVNAMNGSATSEALFLQNIKMEIGLRGLDIIPTSSQRHRRPWDNFFGLLAANCNPS